MWAAVEFARRVLGKPIKTEKGDLINPCWPVASADHPRIYWIIGWDTKHIGQTIHKLLFQPGMGGQFRVIPDEKTGEWRAYNRANPRDALRYKASRLAEPLIPDRYIVPDGWDFEAKSANQFNAVRLTNGATIFAYPSSARNPKQGDAVSGIWIDEDIQFPSHIKEWQDRLTDEEGWFMWSVWPHDKNDALLNLIDRAESCVGEDNPQIEHFQLIMTENPYLTDKGKMQSLGRMETDEEIARRNRGDLLLDVRNMYTMIPSRHLIRKADPAKKPADLHPIHRRLTDIYAESNTFPREWTRYMAIDPSHTRTAVHSWVVPPQEMTGFFLGDVAILEWELVAKKHSAKMLANSLRSMVGCNPYEAFVIDMHAGRQHSIGREERTADVYSEEFLRVGLISRQTQHSFIAGMDVTSVRYRAVRDLMTEQDTGIPALFFVEDKCIETIREFNTYRKKPIASDNGQLLDEPANPRVHDCMACLEYFSAFILPHFVGGTAFVDPQQHVQRGSIAYQRAQQILSKRKEQEGSGAVYLGPGSAA